MTKQLNVYLVDTRESSEILIFGNRLNTGKSPDYHFLEKSGNWCGATLTSVNPLGCSWGGSNGKAFGSFSINGFNT